MTYRKSSEQLQAEILKQMFDELVPLDRRFEGYLAKLRQREAQSLENA